MAETRQIQQPKKKKSRMKDESASSTIAHEKKKLKELDNFIEGVLEQAGEEFLEEFKQIEGE